MQFFNYNDTLDSSSSCSGYDFVAGIEFICVSSSGIVDTFCWFKSFHGWVSAEPKNQKSTVADVNTAVEIQNIIRHSSTPFCKIK